jgi:Bax protein
MSHFRWTEILIIPLMILLLIGFLYLERSTIRRPPLLPVPTIAPDFASYTDVKQKKSAFFAFMLPTIRNANAGVMAERQFLLELELKQNKDEAFTEQENETLRQLAETYRLNEPDLAELLTRVDTVPASLVLAQAANESAWGTSRFAKSGNNYFGIWCFTAGCGKVPSARDAGKTHEVTRFHTVQDGTNYYLLTINSHPAYEALRQRRAAQRQDNLALNGEELANGLLRYSERGEAYVHEIQAMIRVNKLQQFTLNDLN